MTASQTVTVTASPSVPITEAEEARAELAAKMFEFAKVNLPKISDTDRLSGSPANWGEPKTSLMAHPGVSKAVRTLASIAAQNCWFQLNHFDQLEPLKYLREIHAARNGSADSNLAARFDTKAESFAKYHAQTPNIRAEIRQYGNSYHGNTVYAAKTVIQFSHSIVSDWLEVIPAENFHSLLNELEQLQNAPLPAQLRWFGLAEFAMED